MCSRLVQFATVLIGATSLFPPHIDTADLNCIFEPVPSFLSSKTPPRLVWDKLHNTIFCLPQNNLCQLLWAGSTTASYYFLAPDSQVCHVVNSVGIEELSVVSHLTHLTARWFTASTIWYNACAHSLSAPLSCQRLSTSSRWSTARNER